MAYRNNVRKRSLVVDIDGGALWKRHTRPGAAPRVRVAANTNRAIDHMNKSVRKTLDGHKTPLRLVKGSPEAKAYMEELRRKPRNPKSAQRTANRKARKMRKTLAELGLYEDGSKIPTGAEDSEPDDNQRHNDAQHNDAQYASDEDDNQRHNDAQYASDEDDDDTDVYVNLADVKEVAKGKWRAVGHPRKERQNVDEDTFFAMDNKRDRVEYLGEIRKHLKKLYHFQEQKQSPEFQLAVMQARLYNQYISDNEGEDDEEEEEEEEQWGGDPLPHDEWEEPLKTRAQLTTTANANTRAQLTTTAKAKPKAQTRAQPKAQTRAQLAAHYTALQTLADRIKLNKRNIQTNHY